MNKISRKAKTILLGALVVVAFGAGAASANGLTTTIEAIKDARVRVLLNGKFLNLRDAQGKVLSPIMYGGSTYLPVRTISESLNIPVNWDAANRQVQLGERQEYTELKLNVLTDTEYVKFILDPEMLYTPEKSYSYGCIGSANYNDPKFYLAKKYAKFTATVYNTNDSEEKFALRSSETGSTSSDASIVLKSITLAPNETQTFDLDVSGVNWLAFSAARDDVLILEPKLK